MEMLVKKYHRLIFDLSVELKKPGIPDEYRNYLNGRKRQAKGILTDLEIRLKM